ncbi:MAG: M20 family metallopeptidase [Emergencia sp.]
MGFDNKPDVVKLTQDLVRIKSYSFMERQEDEVSKYILDFFEEHGIRTWRTEVEPGRFNVFAVIDGSDCENASSLLLTGHMDTVPAYDFENAFSGNDDEEYVYGRGTCDMKGALAAMMCAMVSINKSEDRPKGDLIFCGVCDEEEAGIGTRDLIKTGPEADFAIVGEPTDMAIALGHKGLEWIEVRFTGKKVHGGDQKNGVNAIMMASRFLHVLETEYIPELSRRTHPVLGAATLNVGTIVGGDQPSTVADKCTVKLDRRCLPSETIEQVYSELQDIIDRLHAEDERFVAEISDVFEGQTLPHIPFCTPETSPVVEAAKEALQKEEISPVVTFFPAWTDAGFMNEFTKSRCIVLGPGEIAVAHSVHERISKEQLMKASGVYTEIARRICF